MPHRNLDVLVIDDDDITIELLERALRREEFPMRLIAANDGADGIARLRKVVDGRAHRPCIVLVDLNMPRMNGFEFLDAVREDPALANSVVFVLTTSDAESDRDRAYRRQVAGYMVKSQVGPRFARVAGLLRHYGTAVKLPG